MIYCVFNSKSCIVQAVSNFSALLLSVEDCQIRLISDVQELHRNQILLIACRMVGLSALWWQQPLLLHFLFSLAVVLLARRGFPSLVWGIPYGAGAIKTPDGSQQEAGISGEAVISSQEIQHPSTLGMPPLAIAGNGIEPDGTIATRGAGSSSVSSGSEQNVNLECDKILDVQLPRVHDIQSSGFKIMC